MNTQDRLQGIGAWARSRTGIITIALLGIAGFFLVVVQNTRIFGLLPFALLLLCPLTMLFMHGGHGGKEEHQRHSSSNDKANDHEGNSKREEL